MGEEDSRWGLVYPDDGESAPADGLTRSTPADLDPTNANWGDVLQSLIYLRNQHDGAVGDLADRPAAGPDAPRVWLSIGATDAAPTLYYNDESVPTWAVVNAAEFVDVAGDTMAGTLDMGGNDLLDATATIWDATAGHMPVGSQQAGFGASNEAVLLGAAGSGSGTSSTTSTTYTAVLNNSQNGIVPTDRAQRTGISDYAVSGIWEMGNDTAGETTSARVIDETNAVALSSTEVTHTGTGSSIHHTPVVVYNPGGAFVYNVEVKVTAGSGTVQANPTVLLWGVRS